MLKHSPGPWRAETGCTLSGTSIYDAKGNIVIGGEWDGQMTPFSSRPDEEAEANVLLTLAAPRLLAMLMQTRGQWIHSMHAEECIAVIRAAGVSASDFPDKGEVGCAVEEASK